MHNRVPRTSLHSSAHPSISISLKELRTFSHRLASLTLPYVQDLQILERLYYKSKNQHRSSLFWKKVVEVRRLAKRVNGLNLHRVVEGFRFAFYGAENEVRAKSLRSAWTHAPDLDTCKSILKTLRSACCLIYQARARFRAACQLFTVQLRMAAFLPLIVSLVAITSRFDFLLSEVHDIIPPLWEAIISVMNAIDTNYNWKNERGIQLPLLAIGLSPSVDATSNRPRKRVKLSDETVEDLGSKVDQRIEPLSTDFPVSNDLERGSWAVRPMENAMHAESIRRSDTPLILSAPMVEKNNVTSLSSDLPAPSVANHKGGSSAEIKRNKHGKTKAKKKRDEIDDIFGF